mgnify:CR=1 FL=1
MIVGDRFHVALAVWAWHDILGQGLGLGVIGVWIAMTMDWVVRAFLFTNRIRTGKWLKYKDRLVK